MKNLTISLAAMTLLFAGCQKPELVEPAADNLSFEATVEEFGGQTKTSLTSENYVVWSEGDRLAIFQGSAIADEYQLVEGSAGQNKGMFDLVEDKSGTVNGSFSAGTELPRNVAFYPYAEGVTLTGDMEGNKTAYILSNVVLPATQNYAANSFGNGSFPMVAATKSMEDHNLKFKNVLGAVKLSFKGMQKVKSIKVEGLNGEKLSGDATVTAYSNNLNPVIQMLSNASSAVTLDCGDGVLLNESEVTDFYIALPPVLFEKGFNVTVTDVADHEYTMTADQNNAVLRSSILVMPEQTLEAKEDDTPSDKSRDYVDEYGINHGPGVEIDGVVWAPVNCGYHATDYKWGKLYQWGRKYGQGYSDGNFQDAEVADVQSLQFSDDEAQSETYKNTYFNGSSDWFSGSRTISLWNDGTEDAPIKTDKDPCPEGWRVPTKTEFAKLIEHHSDFIQNEEGMNGYYFSGSSAYISNVPNIFLSAAGWRNYGSTYMQSKTQYRNEYATYFTSTLLESPYRLASVLSFDQSEVEMKGHERANAFSIRCVQDLESGEAPGEDEEDELVIPVMNVTLNPTSLILYEDDSAQLEAKVKPTDATDKTIVWSSVNTAVATVDQTGLVTAVSVGTAEIKAKVGEHVATCTVEVKEKLIAKDYVDEYGINHGRGTRLGIAVWAPVNCGYHATDYKWGKLYQWGRKYGQGYTGDATTPEISEGGVSFQGGQSENNKNVFYICPDSPYDWLYQQNGALWNSGTEESPKKTEYDPCPEGWRVPTYNELSELCQNHSSWTTNDEGQSGYWFSGASSYTETVPQVFFPAAGSRHYISGDASTRGDDGFYWSSRPTNDYGAYYLHVIEGAAFMDSYTRAHGYSLRCVQD